MKNSRIIILGAGLGGLYTAYLLEKAGFSCTILEASERVGGRIYTDYKEGHAAVELGATWLDKSQINLIDLLQELQIEIFEQFIGDKAIYDQYSGTPAQLVSLPRNEHPSYRIVGGTEELIQKMGQKLNHTQILLAKAIKKIEINGSDLIVSTEDESFEADFIINTIPPCLFAETVEVGQLLDLSLLDLMKSTHTWMGDSIKIAIRYEKPFWKVNESSGTIFSNVGPATEMYDQSDVTNEVHALVGFMNGAYFSLTSEKRKEMLVNQLVSYYGSEAKEFVTYDEAVWKNEKYTFHEYGNHVLPKQHCGHPAYQKAHMDGRFYLVGAEIGQVAHGHMEAVLASAKNTVELIADSFPIL